MKFLVFLRDPADFLYSMSYCPSSRSFNAWFTAALRRSAVPEMACPLYTINEWMHHFPPSRFLFISSERFSKHPVEHVMDVLDFLGLPNNVSAIPTAMSH